MTNRTVQFYGQGYAPTGTNPITITATLNGNVVYTGNISTLYTTDIGRLPTDQTVLFTCELPMDFVGTAPMSITIDSPVNSDVYFEQVLINYVPGANPVYTQSEFNILTDPSSTSAEKISIYTAKAVPPLDAAEIAILQTGTNAEIKAVLAAHNISLYVSSGANVFANINTDQECRSNVVINGTPQTRGDTPPGDWGWEVELSPDVAGDGTITYDLTVAAGLE